jgi:hypothetical protein
VPTYLQILPHTHILLARSPASYSPCRGRTHSPTTFSGPMAHRLPPPRVLLPHTCTRDGFCNHNADQLGSLAGLSSPAVYVGVVACAPASLPPASSSLTHARGMDGFCNHTADQLGSLAGPSSPAAYVGVVACAPASPYTYSTHRFPDERTPIEAKPLSATSAELGTGLGLDLGLGSHFSSHAPSHAPLLLATLISHNLPFPRVQ